MSAEVLAEPTDLALRMLGALYDEFATAADGAIPLAAIMEATDLAVLRILARKNPVVFRDACASARAGMLPILKEARTLGGTR